MKTNRLWIQVIEYYEKAIKDGENMLPYLKIAKKLANSSHAKYVFPVSFSHALNLSKTLDYHEGLKKPLISIKHLGKNRFKVIYLPKINQKETKYICNSQEVWNLLESLFPKL